MSDLRTRWYLGRTIDGAALPVNPRAGCSFPSLFAHYDTRTPGVWLGALDVAGLDFQVVAVTWDLDTVGEDAYAVAAETLAEATDDDVLDFPANLTTKLADWGGGSKVGKLRTQLDRGKLDRDRPNASSSAKDCLREIVREVLMQQQLNTGEFLKTRQRDHKVDALPSAQRTRLHARALFAGMHRWRKDETVHEWFSRVLDCGHMKSECHLGVAGLGRKEANLL